MSSFVTHKLLVMRQCAEQGAELEGFSWSPMEQAAAWCWNARGGRFQPWLWLSAPPVPGKLSWGGALAVSEQGLVPVWADTGRCSLR